MHRIFDTLTKYMILLLILHFEALVFLYGPIHVMLSMAVNSIKLIILVCQNEERFLIIY